MGIKHENKSEPEHDYIYLYIQGFGHLTETDVDEFGQIIASYMVTERPIKLFLDTRKMDAVDIKLLPYVAEQLRIAENDIKKSVLATSVLVQNKAIETVINMLFTIRKPVTPIKVTAKIEKACNHLNKY